MTNTLWSIASDQPLLTSIQHGTTFTLIQATGSAHIKYHTINSHGGVVLSTETPKCNLAFLNSHAHLAVLVN